MNNKILFSIIVIFIVSSNLYSTSKSVLVFDPHNAYFQDFKKKLSLIFDGNIEKKDDISKNINTFNALFLFLITEKGEEYYPDSTECKILDSYLENGGYIYLVSWPFTNCEKLPFWNKLEIKYAAIGTSSMGFKNISGIDNTITNHFKFEFGKEKVSYGIPEAEGNFDWILKTGDDRQSKCYYSLFKEVNKNSAIILEFVSFYYIENYLKIICRAFDLIDSKSLSLLKLNNNHFQTKVINKTLFINTNQSNKTNFKINIFDVSGKSIHPVNNIFYNQTISPISFKNNGSGIYLINIKTPNFNETIKLFIK